MEKETSAGFAQAPGDFFDWMKTACGCRFLRQPQAVFILCFQTFFQTSSFNQWNSK
jgi:hypothetical protein